MMKMYLNGLTNEPIDVTSYTRNLDVTDPAIRFHLNFNFSDNYSAETLQYLAKYADTKITSIQIVNEEDGTIYLNDPDTNGILELANETCSDVERFGYGVITTYEANAGV